MGLKLSCCMRPNVEENKSNEIIAKKNDDLETIDVDNNKDFKVSQNINEPFSEKKRITNEIHTLEGGDNTIDTEKRKNLKANQLGKTDKIEEDNENENKNISHDENESNNKDGIEKANDENKNKEKNEIVEFDENKNKEKNENNNKNEIVEVDGSDQNFEYEFKPINKKAMNQKTKATPQNEIKLENEDRIYEISDEKSDKIFEMFDNVRLYPSNYINQVNEEKISNLLKEVEKTQIKPNALIKENFFFYQFREALMNIYATPRDDEDLLDDVYKNFFKDFKNYKYYYVECPINNEEEAVWNLLKKYEKDAIKELLLKYISYCLICALPIIDSDKMKVYFMILE